MIKPGALAIISPMAVGGLITYIFVKSFDFCLLSTAVHLLPSANEAQTQTRDTNMDTIRHNNMST